MVMHNEFWEEDFTLIIINTYDPANSENGV